MKELIQVDSFREAMPSPLMNVKGNAGQGKELAALPCH